MTEINLTTKIQAPIAKCFDLARSIDLHILSMAKTNEKAIAGRLSGLCEAGDEVTWEAVHFGIKQNLSVRITKMDAPYFFEDKMLRGAFKSMRHEHHFEEKNGITYMHDTFQYEVPFGLIGKIFDRLVLKRYMTILLLKRNGVLKHEIELSQAN